MENNDHAELKIHNENIFNELHLTHKHTNKLQELKNKLYKKYAVNKINKETVIINNIINELSKLISTFQYLSEDEQVSLTYHVTKDILKLLKYTEDSVNQLLKLDYVKPILTIHIQKYEKKLATCCGFMRS